MRSIKPLLLSAALAFMAGPAASHEFWIDPQAYQVQPGSDVKAHLRVGQEFNGSAYPYRPSQIERFDLVMGDTATPVEARIGDNPALDMTISEEGLLVVVHETADNRLTYTEFEKFGKFAKHKAFTTALEDHKARGISTERFVETYRRYAKALIAIGEGAGTDSAVGMKTEIVALANPYTDNLSEMPVQVLLDGAPRVDAQVELFDMDPSGEVEITLYRTDAEGKASFPVTPGHSYLVDAVTLEALPNDDPESGPVWKTHWAALTFATRSR